jgi:autotransporter-associated beta strand protein
MCWDIERFPVFRVFGNAGAHNHPMQISKSASFPEARTAKVATLLLSVLALVLNALLAPPLLAQYAAGSPVVLGGSNDSGTFDTLISGTSTVTKSGTGVFTLTGTNTYTGNTIISGGTLTAGGTQAFGSGSIVNLANTDGALLDLNGYGNTIGALAGGGTLGGNVALGGGTLTLRTAEAGAKDGNMINCSNGHSLVLKRDGSVWATGYNGYGQLGDRTTITRTISVRVMSEVSAIACGWYHSLFLKSDGSVWASGRNTVGQLGVAGADGVPVRVMGGVMAIACGNSHSLFLKNDGTVWATGLNTYGQLGIGAGNSTVSTPVQVMTGVIAIACGASHSLF